MRHTLANTRWPRARSLLLIEILAACSLVTEPACGCPPARTHVILVGQVVESTSTPVAAARLTFAGFQTTFDTTARLVPLSTDWPVTTDSTGRFRARLFSPLGGGLYQLRVWVTRVNQRDSVLAFAGTGSFVLDSAVPDTTTTVVRLP